jgi:hypothetical protein
MLNDFLPAIIAVSILLAVFVTAWIADIRRLRRLRAPRREPGRATSLVEMTPRKSTQLR